MSLSITAKNLILPNNRRTLTNSVITTANYDSSFKKYSTYYQNTNPSTLSNISNQPHEIKNKTNNIRQKLLKKEEISSLPYGYKRRVHINLRKRKDENSSNNIIEINANNINNYLKTNTHPGFVNRISNEINNLINSRKKLEKKPLPTEVEPDTLQNCFNLLQQPKQVQRLAREISKYALVNKKIKKKPNKIKTGNSYFDYILNEVCRKVTYYSSNNVEISDDFVINLLDKEAMKLKIETNRKLGMYCTIKNYASFSKGSGGFNKILPLINNTRDLKKHEIVEVIDYGKFYQTSKTESEIAKEEELKEKLKRLDEENQGTRRKRTRNEYGSGGTYGNGTYSDEENDEVNMDGVPVDEHGNPVAPGNEDKLGLGVKSTSVWDTFNKKFNNSQMPQEGENKGKVHFVGANQKLNQKGENVPGATLILDENKAQNYNNELKDGKALKLIKGNAQGVSQGKLNEEKSSLEKDNEHYEYMGYQREKKPQKEENQTKSRSKRGRRVNTMISEPMKLHIEDTINEDKDLENAAEKAVEKAEKEDFADFLGVKTANMEKVMIRENKSRNTLEKELNERINQKKIEKNKAEPAPQKKIPLPKFDKKRGLRQLKTMVTRRPKKNITKLEVSEENDNSEILEDENDLNKEEQEEEDTGRGPKGKREVGDSALLQAENPYSTIKSINNTTLYTDGYIPTHSDKSQTNASKKKLKQIKAKGSKTIYLNTDESIPEGEDDKEELKKLLFSAKNTPKAVPKTQSKTQLKGSSSTSRKEGKIVQNGPSGEASNVSRSSQRISRGPESSREKADLKGTSSRHKGSPRKSNIYLDMQIIERENREKALEIQLRKEKEMNSARKTEESKNEEEKETSKGKNTSQSSPSRKKGKKKESRGGALSPSKWRKGEKSSMFQGSPRDDEEDEKEKEDESKKEPTNEKEKENPTGLQSKGSIYSKKKIKEDDGSLFSNLNQILDEEDSKKKVTFKNFRKKNTLLRKRPAARTKSKRELENLWFQEQVKEARARKEREERQKPKVLRELKRKTNWAESSMETRVKDLKVIERIKYQMINETSEEGKERYKEMLNQIESLKKSDVSSYIASLELEFEPFQEEIDALVEARKIEDRLNKFLFEFEKSRSYQKALHETQSETIRIKDNRFITTMSQAFRTVGTRK